MYYLTEINFIFLFVVLAGSITVDFAGYFDFNRKWTYSYQLVKTTSEVTKSDVKKQARTATTETDKEISSAKNKNELNKSTQKTRFSVTGHYKKVTNKNSEVKKKKNPKNLEQETTTTSDENLEINIEGSVIESVMNSPSIDRTESPLISGKISVGFTKRNKKSTSPQQAVTFSDETLENTLKSPSKDDNAKKPAVTSQVSLSLEDDTATEKKKRDKGLQLDVLFSGENHEINSEEHITKSVTSPSTTRDSKKQAVTTDKSWSLEDEFTTEKRNHKGVQHDLSTLSEENLEINSEEDITESVVTSPPIDHGGKKQAVTDQMSWSSEVDVTKEQKKHQKASQHDMTTLRNKDLEINNEEDIAESVSTSPLIDRGGKKLAVSDQLSRSFEEDITAIKNKKYHESLEQYMSFSDENLETNSEKHITESVLTSASIDRSSKKLTANSQIGKSFEEYDITTEKKRHHRGQQHDLTTSDENIEINSEEHITESVSITRGSEKQAITYQMSWSSEDEIRTEQKKHIIGHQRVTTVPNKISEKNMQGYISKSILTSPSITRNGKKQTVTEQLSWSSEEKDTATEKEKYKKGLQRESTTFYDQNLKTNGVQKLEATSKISTSIEEDGASIKKNKHHKKRRHHRTTSFDEYSDQEYATETDLKSPSIKDDSKKSTTTATTNVSTEEDTTTKKRKRHKKHKKASKKIVYGQSSDSRQDTDMYSLEDGVSIHKINQGTSRESQSLEKYMDTTTENVFNTMRPQYFNEGVIGNISAHTIEEDPQVKYFIGHILRSALKIFSYVKNKTKSPNLAAKLDLLADKYVARYNIFVDEIKKNKIKTALGTQKVLLNAIESSDHMMNRIVHYIMEDTSNKDILRTSVNVANEFKEAVNKETNDKYTYICRMMEVCHAKSGFANFLNDYISIILLCDDSKFEEAVKSFTEVTKKINFTGTFDTAARLNILRALKYIENQDLKVQRIILMVIRNIVAYKNEPLKILKSDRAVNSTLAIWEILEAFETKLLRSDANIIIWGDLRTNLREWAHYRRSDIHDTMNNFMFYLKTALDDMPPFIKKRIAHNIGVIMNRKVGM